MPRLLLLARVFGWSVAALAWYGTTGCSANKCAPPSEVAMVPPAPPAPAPPPPTLAPEHGAAAARAPSADDMRAVAATLERFHAAAAAADEPTYFALFADGGVFMGTDAKERWTVPQFRAYAHPRFASGKAWSFRAVYREIALRADTAWFDESLDTPNLGPARGSGVLVREPNGEWKIAQYNLSVPIPNERFAEVKKVIDGSPAGAPPKPGMPKPTPTPTPAPAPPSAAGRTDPPICAAARAARARSSPAAPSLEAQCRAQGGTP